MPINVEVFPRPYEPLDKLLKRFNKACKKSEVLRLARERSSFKTNRQKRQAKSEKHRRLVMKKNRKRENRE
jgi:ribosomal protein S21